MSTKKRKVIPKVGELWKVVPQGFDSWKGTITSCNFRVKSVILSSPVYVFAGKVIKRSLRPQSAYIEISEVDKVGDLRFLEKSLVEKIQERKRS